MRRNTLTTAVLAGLTGMAGMVSVSNAVNVNPDGLGQALLYPYYSVRGGNDTLISIVNTSDEAKSVKIRFLEGLNSREVLDFNIYMSAFDVWVGAVTADGEGGAKLVVQDETCTVPYFFGDWDGEVEFVNFQYTGDNADGGPTGLERLQSGYFEVLDMGTLTDETEGSATAATHVDGTPANCQQLVDAWTQFPPGDPQQADAYWRADRTTDHEVPFGGVLFGAASIINVPDGTMLSYNPTALDNWTESITHSDPGFVTPRLTDGGVTSSNVFINGANDQQDWETAREAVNATLMIEQLMNEYVIETGFAASEWVLTFPTKRFHVDAPGDPGVTDEALDPFTALWTTEDPRACEPVSFRLWDREERELGIDLGDPIPPRPSPLPPEQPEDVDLFELCWEANVVRFANQDNLDVDATEVLKETRFTTLGLPDGFDAGWAKFDLGVMLDPATGQPTGEKKTSGASASGDAYVGLPVIGFLASRFTNSALAFEGTTVLSNYAGTFNHRGTRLVESAQVAD